MIGHTNVMVSSATCAGQVLRKRLRHALQADAAVDASFVTAVLDGIQRAVGEFQIIPELVLVSRDTAADAL